MLKYKNRKPEAEKGRPLAGFFGVTKVLRSWKVGKMGGRAGKVRKIVIPTSTYYIWIGISTKEYKGTVS